MSKTLLSFIFLFVGAVSAQTFAPGSEASTLTGPNISKTFILPGDEVIPQIANGELGGGQSFFTLFQAVNISGGPASVTVSFFDGDGDPMTLPIQDGVTINANMIGDAIAPGGVRFARTVPAAAPNHAGAQQQPARSFEELRASFAVKQGDKIRVVNQDGKSLEGRFAGLSGSSLRLTVRGAGLFPKPADAQVFDEAAVKEIRLRRPDRWWDGMAIGAGIGAVLGMLPQKCGNPDVCDQWGHPLNIVPLAFLGTAAGAGIDALIREYDTIFTGRGTGSHAPRFNIEPIVSAQRKGIRFAVTL